jgi:hypothetical protein
MYTLKEVLNHIEDTENSDVLVSYLVDSSFDRVVEELDVLGIQLSYEDYQEQSVHSLAEFILEEYNHG